MPPHWPSTLDDIDLANVEFWRRPSHEREAAFRLLRIERPVAYFDVRPPAAWKGLPQGPGYWAVTRYADIESISRQPEIFSSAAGATTLLDLPPPLLEFFGSFIHMDDPAHMRLRKLVSTAFGPRCLQDLEHVAQRVLDETIDAVIEKGDCDLVTELCAPFPIRIICELMGVPRSQYAFVLDRTNLILGAADPEYLPPGEDAVRAVLKAGQELAELVKELAAARRAAPEDDLTSVLAHAELEGDRLSESELASFFILLVTTGNETTRHALSHGLKALSDHPEQKAIWQSDVAGCTPSAVEEIVRWSTPVIFMRRTALRPTRIADQAIDAGEKVVMYYASANRDETVFAEPQRFDVRRSPNRHVGFGAPGTHYCLGTHLARREITLFFREIYRRMPDLEVTSPPEMLVSHFIHGIKHMRGEFTASRPSRTAAS